jgi:hypothetical protein
MGQSIAKEVQDVTPGYSQYTEARHRLKAHLPKGSVQRHRDLIIGIIRHMLGAAPHKHLQQIIAHAMAVSLQQSSVRREAIRLSEVRVQLFLVRRFILGPRNRRRR